MLIALAIVVAALFGVAVADLFDRGTGGFPGSCRAGSRAARPVLAKNRPRSLAGGVCLPWSLAVSLAVTGVRYRPCP